MSSSAFPSFIQFSIEDRHQETDDRSELTGSCYSDDLSREDEFGIKCAADPYYYHTLCHDSHSFLPEKQELLKLQLQISRQQEKIDILSSKLSECETENEVLKAENKALLDALPLAAQEETTKRAELPLLEANGNNDNAGPLKMLVDLNANLTTENARLQAIVGITRKSFKSHINESRLYSNKCKQTIKDLQRGNGELPQQRGPPCACKLFKRSLSSHTAETSLRSSFTQSIMEDWPLDLSLQGDSEESAEGDEIEAANNSRIVAKRATRRKTMDCILSEETKQAFFVNESAEDETEDVRANETRRPTRAMVRRHSVQECTDNRKVDDLLVDFGETRRPRSAAKRWSSFKSLRIEL